jgi:predicted ester cyclase
MPDAQFIHRWFEEVWNNKNEAAIDDMLSPDVIGHGLQDPDGNDKIIGPQAFKRLHRQFVGAFPDIHIEVRDTVVEGDKIGARCRVTGTHSGNALGLTPTNARVNFTGMLVVRVENEKIVEAWNQFDFMTMYTQLGALSLNVQ